MTSSERWIWHELAAHAAHAVIPFYAEAFQWRVDEDADVGVAGYRVVRTRDARAAAGGLYEMAGPMATDSPSHWLPYLHVEDVDDAAAKCEELAGAVLAAPMDQERVGRTAVLSDICGAIFAIVTKADVADHTMANGEGCWSNHVLITDDIGLTTAFYKGVFGWEAQPDPDDPLRTVFFVKGAKVGEAFCPTGDLENMPSQWIAQLAVGDVPKALDLIRAGGGRRLGALDRGGGVAVCDPGGACFGVRPGV